MLIELGTLCIEPETIVGINPRGDGQPGACVRYRFRQPGEQPGHESVGERITDMPYERVVERLRSHGFVSKSRDETANETAKLIRGGSGLS